MKFGHQFKQYLKNEGFPPDWVESAISYQQLKKCINRLTNELTELGLNPQTLKTLLQQVEDYNASTNHDDYRPLEYLLSADDNGNGTLGFGERKKPFHPKLLFYVNEATGELDSAGLGEETRQKLQLLATGAGMTNLRLVEEPLCGSACPEGLENTRSGAGPRRRPGYRTVEVPLTSDSEFFSKLVAYISGLELLQEKEERRMHVEIEALGKQMAQLTNPNRRANKKLIAVWRQIFQIYLESDIFFGSTETDHASRDFNMANQRFITFSKKIAEQGLVAKFTKPETQKALSLFLHINGEILLGLRFGEINRLAMNKILKKFDKQTSLGVKSEFPRQIEYPEFSEHLAKAVCAEVNTQILSSVPQLDDYNCPMCMELKWRPVTLRCRHTFCIRCLIVMQTNKQHHCPLCRELTVEDANSDNLDLEMAVFLKKWFPEEVKQKQRQNEVMAGVDQYGEVYKERCSVM